MNRFYLVIDLGTTQARACLVDRDGRIAAIQYCPLTSYYPHPGWVEQDPLSLWRTVRELIARVLAGTPAQREISALALTNQRGTVIVWEEESGKPVYPAIVWQDRRQWEFVDVLRARPLYQELRRKTGVIPSSAQLISKLRWILDKVPHIRKRAEAGELMAGTPDTWLLWKMSGGKIQATDYSNAGITGLFNLETLTWDADLLAKLAIPAQMLARDVKPSAASYGLTDPATIGMEIPIAAVAGDQHAAMLGYGCIDSGQAQVTIGTGAFLLINTGNQPRL
ncbi:MAG: FGGY family carbohydrate kinase, partial [Deltaproteobacteria bacterium]|nr:FGGY family carbohydrate kinase [Deltaproteobacteria bacterium]